MYNNLRCILGLIILGICFVLKRKGALQKPLAKYYLLIVWLLYIGLVFYPIENIIIRFNTLEESVRYSFPRESIVMEYEYPYNSFSVIQGESEKLQFRSVEHDNKGWKIVSPNMNLDFNLYAISTGKSAYTVTRVCGSGEKPDFLFVTSGLHSIESVSDSLGNSFNEVVDSVNSKYNAYYTFSATIPDNYQIMVNDELIELKNSDLISNRIVIIIQFVGFSIIIVLLIFLKRKGSRKIKYGLPAKCQR